MMKLVGKQEIVDGVMDNATLSDSLSSNFYYHLYHHLIVFKLEY